MAEKNSYLTLGVAIAVGLIVGAALGARNSGEIELVGKRIETQVSEQVGALEARIAALSAEDPRVDALGARIDEIAAQAGTQAEALGAQLGRVAAVDDRVSVLAEQMAGLVNQVQALAAATPAGSLEAAPAPAATEAAPAGDSAPAAASAAAAPSDDPAAALAARLGEGGAAMAVGETVQFGETAVFLSRVDVAARNAHVVVVGQGPATVGDSAGSLALGDGCDLTLVGVLERRAFLQPVCAQ